MRVRGVVHAAPRANVYWRVQWCQALGRALFAVEDHGYG